MLLFPLVAMEIQTESNPINVDIKKLRTFHSIPRLASKRIVS